MAYHCDMRRLVLALLLSACATESANGPGARSPRTGDEIVCSDETTTGSAISRRVCRGPEQRANEESYKQSWMTGFRPNPTRGDSTYPGVDLRHPAPPPSTETTYLPPQPQPPSPTPE
jgi:hypothetical protein